MTKPPPSTVFPRPRDANQRVPGYLGRVLRGDEPVGTCFQVATGILVTGLHVLEQVGANRVGDAVTVDALAGGREPFTATVVAIHLSHDLAILGSPQALSVSVSNWAASDSLPLGTSVETAGASAFADPEDTHRHVDARGIWAGGTMRDDHIPLGRMRLPDVVPGMSGAPILRKIDGRVVGVVSARYNSADGWLPHSVWVTRSEDVQALLRGTVDVLLETPPSTPESFDLTLVVDDSEVRLLGPQVDVSARHQGITPGLQNALGEVYRERARAASTSPSRTSPHDMPATDHVEIFSLRRAGELAGESFLPSTLSLKLAQLLREAVRLHQPMRIGVDPGNQLRTVGGYSGFDHRRALGASPSSPPLPPCPRSRPHLNPRAAAHRRRNRGTQRKRRPCTRLRARVTRRAERGTCRQTRCRRRPGSRIRHHGQPSRAALAEAPAHILHLSAATEFPAG